MSNALSRADFCRLSLTGLLGAAACKGAAPGPEHEPPKPASAAAAPPPVSASPPKTEGVPKRKLGSTGQEVSMLGLGGAHIGDPDKLTDDDAIALMRAAIDGGITFFDNCWD